MVPRLRLVVRFALLTIILVLVDSMRLCLLFDSGNFRDASALVHLVAVIADCSIAGEHLLEFGRFILVRVGEWSVHRGSCVARLVRAWAHVLVVTKWCLLRFVVVKCNYVRAVAWQMLGLRSSCNEFS